MGQDGRLHLPIGSLLFRERASPCFSAVGRCFLHSPRPRRYRSLAMKRGKVPRQQSTAIAVVRNLEPCSRGRRSTSGKAVFSYMLLGEGLNLFDRCGSVTITPGQTCSALWAISRVCIFIHVYKWATAIIVRSEEHTSELQSRPHLVCRLLLEKKNSQECCALASCPLNSMRDVHLCR